MKRFVEERSRIGRTFVLLTAIAFPDFFLFLQTHANDQYLAMQNLMIPGKDDKKKKIIILAESKCFLKI